jgi:hypothetical protein
MLSQRPFVSSPQLQTSGLSELELMGHGCGGLWALHGTGNISFLPDTIPIKAVFNRVVCV